MHRWIRELLILLIPALLGIAIANLWDCWLAGLTIVLALYLAYSLLQLWRLARWAKHPDRALPPHAPAQWGAVFDHLYRYQRKQRRRQEQLRHVISRFDRLSEALSDGMVVITQHDELDNWNAAANRLLGFKYPHDRGQHVTNLLRHPLFVAYFASGDYDEPLIIKSPADESRWLQFQIVTYGDNERLMVVRDITRLQRLQEMRRDFVANVSHELRTPLTVFTGYLEPLAVHAETLLPPRISKGVTQMQQQADRMRHLIDDLLMLSRLENEQTLSPLTPVCVASLMQRACEDGIALSQGRQQLTLAINSDKGLLGDKEQLRSAVTNLVSNAVRYAGDNRHITLSWSETSTGQGHLSIEDDGEGIDSHHLARLTERFYRVDKGRSSATGGTGLGLAIVKHVMLRHQGGLEIDSTLGKGSRFTLSFPAQRLHSPDSVLREQ
ncbi:phosphate regulon sensor histidine kinase PhoR [Carnimonas nigrificans]|uniref:phosphate regulon sensor histidine kinase PhoR n=1 Tax=Carnimonas nigrificans TaxID=64323 RepID=UPI0004716E43|nr:phosphate regulon sensor histidine kinase PhoR [Carnimonas nigrificans]